MQKTKEDFIGASITQNVKYSDNDWQCYGSVDRKSVYTSESILDLILEDYKYDRDNSCFNYYPRGDVPGSNVSAATLSHDIILVNSVVYKSSNVENYCTINNLTNYLSYGILVTNPVYNPLSKYKEETLIDLDVWKTSDATLGDFVSIFLPQTYINGNWANPSNVIPANTTFLNILYTKYCKGNSKGLKSLTYATTLRDFAAAVESAGKSKKLVSDFSLHMHDPKSVKLPFYPRGDYDDIMQANLATYFTRVFPNLTLSNVFSNTMSKFYIEYVSDAFENEFSSSSDLLKFTGLDSKDVKSTSFDAQPTSVYKAIAGNISSNSEDGVERDTINVNNICNSIVVNEEAKAGGYSAYLPNLYLGELDSTSSLSYQNSFGIHLINPLDKTTVFREDDIKYDVYGSLVLGYNYVDALLTQRSFLGSILTILSVDDQVNSQDSDASSFSNLTSITENDPLDKFQKSSYYEFYRRTTGKEYDKGSYTGYMAVSSLMAFAYLGKTGKLPAITSVNSGTALEFTNEYESIGKWLQNETFLVKTPIYGDFVEPVNFNQDLHPDADVTFGSLRLQKSSNAIGPYDDSKTEVPYVAKTNPLINLNKNEKGFGVAASNYLPGLGNLNKDTNFDNKTSPAFLYDFNKGDEENDIVEIDDKTKTNGEYKQRVKSNNADMTIEGEIESPTIDELWVFLKYLTESTGFGGETVNRELPSFFGIKSSSVGVSEKIEKARVNNKADASKDVASIDILDWSPIANKSITSFYDSEESKELQYAGYEILNYIPKVEDYKVSLFGRLEQGSTHGFGNVYEFNTEAGGYKEVSNYMLPALNQIDLALDSDVKSEWYTEDKKWSDNLWRNYESKSSGKHEAIEDYKNLNRSEQQKKLQSVIHKIFDYEASDTLHNHYKEYLEHPKNLKTIERDLEAIRQNLMTFAEYVVSTTVLKGALDRQTNRGSLHTIHRNFNEFESTFLKNDSIVLRDSDKATTETKLTENVTDLDVKVVYKDGSYETRYKHENFDSYVMDSTGTITNTRKSKRGANYVGNSRLPVNETLLSEVYMGADGQWHSVHEYLIAPVVETEY